MNPKEAATEPNRNGRSTASRAALVRETYRGRTDNVEVADTSPENASQRPSVG